MDYTFYPNHMNRMQEAEIENEEIEAKVNESKNHLLYNNEEEIILNFIHNPFKFKELIDKNEIRKNKALQSSLKLQICFSEKEKFSKFRKLFAWIIAFFIFVISILIIFFSYLYECVSLGCGALAFFLTLLNDLYDMVKPISPSLAKLLRNLIIFACVPLFGIFSLYGDEEFLKAKELSNALFGISVGFFVGLILIKPVTTKAFKQ